MQAATGETISVWSFCILINGRHRTHWHCPCDGCRSDHSTRAVRSKCSVRHYGSWYSVGHVPLQVWCYGSSLWMVPVLPDRPNSSLLHWLWLLWGYVNCLQCTSWISCRAAVVHRLYEGFGEYHQQFYFITTCMPMIYNCLLILVWGMCSILDLDWRDASLLSKTGVLIQTSAAKFG